MVPTSQRDQPRFLSARQARLYLPGLGLIGLALGAAKIKPAQQRRSPAPDRPSIIPFFSKAFYFYGQKHEDVSVNYQSIGSGGEIQQFTAKTVDFGASDVAVRTSWRGRTSPHCRFR